MQNTQIKSYHGDSRKICITEVVEETCVVAWALICERKDLSELGSLMVSAITRLNDYRNWIGWRESCGKGQPDKSSLIG